jgi:CheY-like chemotaxis protein/HPt (histidine-containing phosphotransfer) domain-containing protein
VVDDNATNRLILYKQLAAWGCRVEEAASGPEALGILGAAASRRSFDLILMDMQMPEMDGERATRSIRSDPTWRDVPIILLSSIGKHGNTADIRAAGFTAALVKPVRQSQLYDTLVTTLASPQEMPVPRTAQGAPADRDTEAAPSGPKWRVLVAEDNSVNQKVARRLLEKQGCRVDTVANGREALESLARIRYDLVLMDVQMPEMDGFEATAEIRRHEMGTDRHIPIVALTANAMKGDRERCLEAGMDDYLSKPIAPAELAAALQRWAQRPPEAPQEPGEIGVSTASDWAVMRWEDLLLRCDGDREFESEILQEFEGLMPNFLARIAAAIEADDRPELAHQAHALKGSCQTIGAEAIAVTCRELEQAAGQTTMEEVRGLFARVQGEYRRLSEAIESHLAGDTAGTMPGAVLQEAES